MEESSDAVEALAEIAAGKSLDYVVHESPEIRRLVASSLGASGSIERDEARHALVGLAGDPDENVRAAAVETLGTFGEVAIPVVMTATGDDSMIVVEAAATALGEIGSSAELDWLIATAESHADSLVQEAAVAALGAIGDERALTTLLRLARKGKPQIRRRSLVALTAFDSPEVRAVFAGALFDKNPMVKEVAEMVEGKR